MNRCIDASPPSDLSPPLSPSDSLYLPPGAESSGFGRSSSTEFSSPGKLERPLLPPILPAPAFEPGHNDVRLLAHPSGSPSSPGPASARGLDSSRDQPSLLVEGPQVVVYKPPYGITPREYAPEESPKTVSALLGGKVGSGGVLGPGDVDAWLVRRKTSGASGAGSDFSKREDHCHHSRPVSTGSAAVARPPQPGGEYQMRKATPAGIGISLSPIPSGGMLVANLVPGGPAWQTGHVHAGDELTAVDGRLIGGNSIPDVIRLILGASGTEVTLRLWNEADGTRDVLVRRRAAAAPLGPPIAVLSHQQEQWQQSEVWKSSPGSQGGMRSSSGGGPVLIGDDEEMGVSRAGSARVSLGEGTGGMRGSWASGR